MTERVTPRRRGSYGIDAPYGPALMAAMTVLYLAMAIIAGRWRMFVPATFMLALLGLYLHGTLRAKFVVWAGLLDQLHFGAMNEFSTSDAAAVPSCSWPRNI